MSHEPSADSAGDPLYGNRVSNLLGAAVTPTRPAMDSAQWQPPSCEELQALLHGYDVLQFVARGGMGAVYRGVQRSLGRQVAIKILPPALSDTDPHYAERFKQEARAMGQLNHPGIVAVYDFGEMEDGTLYFIMEFIEGTDVAQMVAKQGRLPSAHAMAITAHVCDALQYAHQCGVVHRDIKPANIMVGYDGRVKVADFGLAKQLRHTDVSLTQSGFVMGTPHFVAPEALTLGLSVDHRADIYAVGVMLYQMLTGKVPQGVFEMPSLQVPGLDPRYDQIIASAMREDRECRYQQILDMRRALDAIMTQPVEKTQVVKPPSRAIVPKPQAGPKQSPRPSSSQSRTVPSPKTSNSMTAIITAGICALLLGSGYYVIKPRHGGPPVVLPLVAAQVASPTSSATAQAWQSSAAIDVKLDFVNNDNESKFDIGGFYGSGAQLSRIKPANVSKLPEGLKSPCFGEFKTGLGANQIRHPFLIDEASTRSPRLFIDRNRNGDFTDDPSCEPLKVTLNRAEDDFAIGGYPFIDMKFGQQTLEARLHVFYKKDKDGNVPHITYRSYYARMGSVRLGSRVIKAMLYDDQLSVDFSHETCTFRLNTRDEASIGYRWEEMEASPVKENFTIEGITYSLSGLSPEGDSFQIVPTAGWLDQTVPAFSAKTLGGQIINVPNDIKGRVLLIHFWSPSKFRSGAGHGFGVEDLPSLKAVHDKHQASGLVLLGVCVEGSTGKTKIPAFMDGNGVAWPQVCDGKGPEFDPLQKLFKNRSVPMNYLIDGDTGKVLATALRGENIATTIDRVMSERSRR